MNKLLIGILTLSIYLPFSASAGTGTGNIIDVTIRGADNPPILLIKVARHNSKPRCASFHHTFAYPYNNNQGKAFYAMALAAKQTGDKVRITGNNSCYSNGIKSERILEMNIGNWAQ